MGQLQLAVFLLILCMSCATMGVHFTPCKEAERSALLNLKHTFLIHASKAKHHILDTWVGNDCCSSWLGVECDNVTGNVFKLDLRKKFLSGEVNPALLELKYLSYLDLSWMNMSQSLDSLHIILNLPSLSVLMLSGCNLKNTHLIIRNFSVSSTTLRHLDLSRNYFSDPFPHFIQNLSSLTFLDLSFNQFNSSVPSWLGNQVNLTHVDLSYNLFSGSFPSFIQNLRSITYIDLYGNQFRSSIPPWLANKTNLEHLSLGGNSFDRVDGGIMNIIAHLCSLNFLDLSYNQIQERMSNSHNNISRCGIYKLQFLYLQVNNFSGHFPNNIGTLSSLQELDLSNNNLEFLPPLMGGLSSLVGLRLSDNHFKVIPWIGNLSSLQTLDVSNNYLETFPPSVQVLSSLVDLYLSHNYLSVVNQASLANLSSLQYLDLSANSIFLDLPSDWLPPFQLHGLFLQSCKMNSPFPTWLLSQKHMEDMDLSDTEILGPLPINIGNAMPSLSSLRLNDNHIDGSIPRSLCDMEGLQILNLGNNSLSGMIPGCLTSSGIGGLDLSSNRLSGPIPFFKMIFLEFLRLNNNYLEGELPLSLGTCYALAILDVGRNYLSGEIPTWSSAHFSHLQILILRENGFKGIIPPQLCSISTLQIIDLASNFLGGNIPQCFGQLIGMGGTMPQSSPTPVGFAFTNLLFAYDTWIEEEVVKGEEREYTKTVLHLLVNMDLSSNNLIGVIPAEITALQLLIGLNLSYNHLNGTIPKEIERMKALESLDLSHNDISGSIPESISSLAFLSAMNLSFNHLQGKIPTSTQLGSFNDSSYIGNSGLCGDPLPNKCFGNGIAQSPKSKDLEDEDKNDKHEKMWLYLVIVLGFATGFWGVIGVLAVKRRWRYAYFELAEHLGDWIYVRVAVRIARSKERN